MADAPSILGLGLEQLCRHLPIALLPAWILLIVLPRAGVTRCLVHSVVPALVLGAVYARS